MRKSSKADAPETNEAAVKAPSSDGANAPAMSFNEALKRVWSAAPMHKTKPKPAAKPAQKKPAK